MFFYFSGDLVKSVYMIIVKVLKLTGSLFIE